MRGRRSALIFILSPGGMGRKGKVTELVDWNSGSLRSAVYVMWESNRRNLYRLGFEGRVSVHGGEWSVGRRWECVEGDRSVGRKWECVEGD